MNTAGGTPPDTGCKSAKDAGAIEHASASDHSLFPRLEGAAEFVSERPKAFRRRNLLAFHVLVYFFDLFGLQDCLDAEANAAPRWVDLEDNDLDVGPHGERSLDAHVTGNTGLAQWDETFDPWFQLDERPELHDARDAAGANLAHLVRRLGLRPRILQ